MRKLRNFKLFAVLLIMAFMMSSLIGCNSSTEAEKNAAPENPQLKLATTTSTQDSGLLDVLKPEFEKETGYELEIIAVGTGAAIGMGENGDVDVILVHSRAAEDKFVADGFGVNRKDVMYNDFLLIGPEDDPAAIKGGNDIKAGLAKIAEAKATFVSRGDESGTHKKEMTIWGSANIEPQGEWYNSVGKGMGDTYRMADEMKGYTLIDRATYLFNKDKYSLVPIIEGDELLFNPYGIIAVNPEKYSNVNYDGAMALIEWITSEEIQQMIGEYGVEQYGQALFVPDAK